MLVGIVSGPESVDQTRAECCAVPPPPALEISIAYYGNKHRSTWTRYSRSLFVAILGYKERDGLLWGMFESDIGIHLQKVGEYGGWPESTPIEFWIGQVRPPPPLQCLCRRRSPLGIGKGAIPGHALVVFFEIDDATARE